MLVHSLAGAKSSIEEVEYGARHDVMTSDHAPVYARFRVHLRSLPHVKSLPRATLKLTTLQVTRTYTEEEIGKNVGSSVYVHLFVPHTASCFRWRESELHARRTRRQTTERDR